MGRVWKSEKKPQVNLGICYIQGLGVPQDVVEAVKWFNEAAEAGHPAGKMNLAISYFEGEGVDVDKEKAVALLHEAAEYMADAQFLLAQCYENGEGAEKDLEKARALYQQAADSGIVEAKEWLENQPAE